MNGQPQDPAPLAALPSNERTRALERYRMLQLCVEHDVPLTHVAHYHVFRCALWRGGSPEHRRYGLAGLSRRGRSDRGHRR